MIEKKTICDIDVKGKKVFVRCDFNVPIKDGMVADDTRIKAAIPTIKYLIDNGAKVILCSHLGRPKGEVKEEFSLKPVVPVLSKELNKDVAFSNQIIGEEVKEMISRMNDGDVLLLENVRFDSREEKNDEEFSKELSELADVFVNDAFGTAHRAHSSTEGISHYLPSVSGFLIQKEIEFMDGALENPKRPFIAILGGAKVSDKIGVIENLINKVDKILIGGGMAFTFFKALGYQIGDSLCEEDKLEEAKLIMQKAKENNVDFVLPLDIHIAKEFSNEAENRIVSSDEIPEGWQGLDIGPKTIEVFDEKLQGAGTVIWNGPLGVCEFEKYVTGTEEIAKSISKTDAISIVGGGDSVAAINKLKLNDKFSHISTGGGASLEFLEGKTLPGIDCLLQK